MANPIEFFRQVRSEVKRIVWPTRNETLMSAIAVLVMVSLCAVFLFLADQVLSFLVRLILDLGV
jgi:preprotein translocase subunit SecE